MPATDAPTEQRLRPVCTFLLVGLLALLTSRLLLAITTVAPWQQPDEPAHLVYTEIARSRLVGARANEVGRQREILTSMHHYNWWRHYRVDTPSVVPDRFYDLGLTEGLSTLGMNPTGDEVLPEYYRLAAVLLIAANPGSIEGDLYLLRGLSAVLGLATLWVGWRAARETLGEWHGVGVAALLALHPQFVLVATTVGPDAIVNLAGACLWWGAIRAMRSRTPLVPTAAMWLAAFAGAAADRLGFPLLGASAIASVFLFVRHRWRPGWKSLLFVGLAAVVLVAEPRIAARWQSMLAGAGIRVGIGERAATWAFFAEFTSLFFQTWWVVFGWLRYRAPDWWFAIPVVLSCAVVVGLVRRFVVRPWGWEHIVIALGSGMIAFQVLAVYWTFFRLDVAAQGRYLFPVLVPTLILLWMGLQAIVPPRLHRHAAGALITTFAVLDALAWLVVGIPAYAS